MSDRTVLSILMLQVALAGCGRADRPADDSDTAPAVSSELETAGDLLPVPPKESRMLGSIPMRCADGGEISAAYWDLPDARVVISSHTIPGAVLPRLDADDDTGYGADSLRWTMLAGDSALYQRGGNTMVCHRDDSIEF